MKWFNKTKKIELDRIDTLKETDSFLSYNGAAISYYEKELNKLKFKGYNIDDSNIQITVESIYPCYHNQTCVIGILKINK